MRLLKLGIYYSTYLLDFYANRPELKISNYSIQHKALIEDCFGSSDFWTAALNKLNYETTELIANAEFLQKQWASEFNAKYDEQNWLFEIATAQIKLFRPDILLIADYSTFTAEFIKNIRRDCPSIRLILGWCGAPYNDFSVFREWDIALSCIPEMVDDFRAKGLCSHHINHAFAPHILQKIDLNSPPEVDFAFVGSVVKSKKFHVERERLLIELVKQTDLQIWSDVKTPNLKERQNLFARRQAYNLVKAARRVRMPEYFLKSLPLIKKAADWESPPSFDQYIDRHLINRIHPPLFGIKMYQKLWNSRVVFNNHINISPVSASNMRIFETTGVGTCLITDWKENISDLFKTDEEVLTYRSAEECVEKVNYVLNHENERRKIAAAGQIRTLKNHTFDNRAAQVDEIIRRVLSSS